MKITIESTEQLVEVDTGRGTVQGRLWKGTTESGIEVICVVTRIGITSDADQKQFELELKACPRTELHAKPQAIPLPLVIPLRMII